jgi:putative DNA primase/helicase
MVLSVSEWNKFERPILYTKEMILKLQKPIKKTFGTPLPKDIIKEIKIAEDVWYQQDKKTNWVDFLVVVKQTYKSLFDKLGMKGVDVEKEFADANDLVDMYLNGLEERLLNPDKTKAIQNKVIFLLASKKRNEATEEIVTYLKEQKHFYSIRNNVAPEIWVYDEGIYKDVGIAYIKETTREMFGDLYTSQIINNIILKIEADCFIDADVFFNKPEVNYIAVQNGLLNIKTKKLEPFTHTKIFFNKMPVKYDTTKQCPNIIKHFETVLKNPDDILTMQELFGDLLRKENKFEKGVMFNGFGRNGKSKTLLLIKEFVGSDNCCSISLEQLEADQYAIGNLLGKMVNLAGDLSRTALKNTGNFKNSIGRDTITANRKNKTHINFVNYAKMFYACNELPITYDNTDGFWSKWIYFDFPYKFVNESDYNKSTEEQRKYLKIMDENIMNQLTLPDELSGLLNWSLDGLERLDNQKRFSDNKTTEEIKNIWIRKSNSLKAFCMDYIIEDYDSYITKKDFSYAYSNYCRKHKLHIVSDKYIKDMLMEEFGVVDDRPLINNERVYVWQGLKFKPNSLLPVQIVYPVQPVYPFHTHYEILNPIASIDTLDNLDTLDKNNKNLYQYTKIPQKNGQNNVTDVTNVTRFDEKNLVWLPCEHPKGEDGVCGKSPCNDLEGHNYCQNHFELIQELNIKDSKTIDLRGV